MEDFLSFFYSFTLILNTFKYYIIYLINTAGTPATTQFGGTSLVTTAFVAIILFSPMVTFGITATPSPIHTLFFIILNLLKLKVYPWGLISTFEP
jgi:hypothetical protein